MRPFTAEYQKEGIESFADGLRDLMAFSEEVKRSLTHLGDPLIAEDPIGIAAASLLLDYRFLNKDSESLNDTVGEHTVNAMFTTSYTTPNFQLGWYAWDETWTFHLACRGTKSATEWAQTHNWLRQEEKQR